MVNALLLAALLGGLPAVQPVSSAAYVPSVVSEVKSAPAPVRPRLIPGYPVRVLCKIEYHGTAYQVWGWIDTENVVHWLPPENPHVPYAPEDGTGTIRNYGVDLGALHRNAIGGTMQTNDPAFSEAWNGIKLNTPPATAHVEHDPAGPCPGPGPCPYPRPNPNPEPEPGPGPGPNPPPPPPVNPELQRWLIPGGMGLLAVLIVLFAVTRKAA